MKTKEKLKTTLKKDRVTREQRVEFSNDIKEIFLHYFDGLTYKESKEILYEIEDRLKEDMKLAI